MGVFFASNDDLKTMFFAILHILVGLWHNICSLQLRAVSTSIPKLMTNEVFCCAIDLLFWVALLIVVSQNFLELYLILQSVPHSLISNRSYCITLDVPYISHFPDLGVISKNGTQGSRWKTP